jgi:hypothetical protein
MWAIAINCLYFALMALVIWLILHLNDIKKIVLVFTTGCAALAYFSFTITSGYFIFISTSFAVIMSITCTPLSKNVDEKHNTTRTVLAIGVLIFVLLWNLSNVVLYQYEEEEDGIAIYSSQENRKKEEVFTQSLPFKTNAINLPYLLKRVGGSACLYDLNSLRCDIFRKLLINEYEYDMEKDEYNRRKQTEDFIKKQEKVEQEVAEFKNRTK